MRNTKTMLATLALGAAVVFAGPAFAEKLKATLSGATEVPANTTAGKGTADIDYDAASKKMSWKLTYSGLTGPATAAHFHGPAEAVRGAAYSPPRPRGQCWHRVTLAGSRAAPKTPFASPDELKFPPIPWVLPLDPRVSRPKIPFPERIAQRSRRREQERSHP